MPENMETHTWETNWELLDKLSSKSGGQGTVRKVRRRTDGVIGALKIMHDSYLYDRVRRFRMDIETKALKLMNGQGTPELLDGNTERYEELGVPLFGITRFIEGPTLAEFVGAKRRLDFDQARTITVILAQTLKRFHESGIHRDLKPDNIILENADDSTPILVDFGMAWTEDKESIESEFRTDTNQELGNRFLRLPEYAPGLHNEDARSDITMLVGILFYMIVGKSPRILVDSEGRMPHETIIPSILEQVSKDTRWPGMQRTFKIGFQQQIQMRFPSIDSLIDALENLDKSLGSQESIEHELSKLAELTERSRYLDHLNENMLEASKAFINTFAPVLHNAGLTWGGSGPNLNTVDEGNLGAEISGFVIRPNQNNPRIVFRHIIAKKPGGYLSWYQVEDGDAVIYYKGLFADPDSLKEAAERTAMIVIKTILQAYTKKWEEDLESRKE